MASWQGGAARSDASLVYVMDNSSVLMVNPEEQDLLVAGCRAALERAHSRSSANAMAMSSVSWITSTSIAQDEQSFLTGGSDGAIHIWSAENGARLASFVHDEDDPVTAAKYSKDSTLIGTGAKSGTLRFIFVVGVVRSSRRDSVEGAPRVVAIVPKAHGDAVTSVDFAVPSRLGGHAVVTGGRDNLVKLWSCLIGSDFLEPPRVQLVQTFAAHTAFVSDVCFLGGLREVFCSSSGDRKLMMWHSGIAAEEEGNDIVNHRCLNRASTASVVSCVAASRWTPANDVVTLVAGSWDGRLELWHFPISFSTSMVDPTTAVPVVSSASCMKNDRNFNSIFSFQAHEEPVYSVSVTSNGKTMISSSIDRVVKIWDAVNKGVLHASLSGFHRDAVIACDISCSGSVAVSGSRAGSVQLWHLARGYVASRFDGHDDVVNHVVFSRDGRYAATASRDGTARLWVVKSGEMLCSMEGHGCSVDGVRFSLDGKTLATSGVDGSARLWEVPSGRLIAAIDDMGDDDDGDV